MKPVLAGRHGASEASASVFSLWATIVATTLVAAVALLVHYCVSFGLLAFAPEWTAPLLIGGITGLASGASWKRAAAGTAIGLVVGVSVARPWFIGNPISELGGFMVSAAMFVLLGSAVSCAVALWLSKSARRGRTEWVAAIVLVGAIVGGMWATTGMVNAGAFSGGANSLNQLLAVRPELGNTPQDHDYYLRLFYDVHDGAPYYDSVARIWLADSTGGNGLPVGVTSYRLPTVFYLWLLLPARGDAIPWGFLVFATLAAAAGFSIGAQLSRPGVAVLGALTVAVAYLLLATTTWVTFVDGWGMAFSLTGIALFIASVRRDSRRLLWAAVAACLAGAVLRELLVYPLVLAAASTLLLPSEKRWRETWPWLAGLACFAAVYAAHIHAIAGRVSPRLGYGFWLRGGPGHLLATVQFFGLYFGGKPWLMPGLVMVGIAGAVCVVRTERRLSVFLVVATTAPLLAFLVFGNGGQETASGAVSGYWGILVVPIALALVPLAIDRLLAAFNVTAEEGRSQ